MKNKTLLFIMIVSTSLFFTNAFADKSNSTESNAKTEVSDYVPSASLAPTGFDNKAGSSSCSCPSYVTTNIAAPACTATCPSPSVASCRCFVRNAYVQPPTINNYCSCR